ncbi:MAG: hypothetical protein OEV40_11825 [Acidimicrobiia bacterium]|nr:hypothetical protein [Acidimicrobiia bacterium]
MNSTPRPDAIARDIDVVARLVRRGELWVDTGGAWLSPEVTLEGNKIILHAYSSDALEESE